MIPERVNRFKKFVTQVTVKLLVSFCMDITNVRTETSFSLENFPTNVTANTSVAILRSSKEIYKSQA